MILQNIEQTVPFLISTHKEGVRPVSHSGRPRTVDMPLPRWTFLRHSSFQIPFPFLPEEFHNYVYLLIIAPKFVAGLQRQLPLHCPTPRHLLRIGKSTFRRQNTLSSNVCHHLPLRYSALTWTFWVCCLEMIQYLTSFLPSSLHLSQNSEQWIIHGKTPFTGIVPYLGIYHALLENIEHWICKHAEIKVNNRLGSH